MTPQRSIKEKINVSERRLSKWVFIGGNICCKSTRKNAEVDGMIIWLRSSLHFRYCDVQRIFKIDRYCQTFVSFHFISTKQRVAEAGTAVDHLASNLSSPFARDYDVQLSILVIRGSYMYFLLLQQDRVDNRSLFSLTVAVLYHRQSTANKGDEACIAKPYTPQFSPSPHFFFSLF